MYVTIYKFAKVNNHFQNKFYNMSRYFNALYSWLHTSNQALYEIPS